MGVLTLKQQKGELCYFMSLCTAAVPVASSVLLVNRPSRTPPLCSWA